MDGTTNNSRRDFLKSSAIVAAGTASLMSRISAGAYAGGTELLKVGLVGCGGRGTGAAKQALSADPQTRLIAVADAFRDAIDGSLSNLKAQEGVADRIVVDDDHKFVGLDSYLKVIETCDVVLLAAPPGFRPQHFKAAVEAGKHIFTEKPMATDVPGILSTMESVELAKKKKLAVVAGFCWRYDSARRELFARLHNGQIGDILAVYGTYLTSPVKPMPPASARPDGISNFEWMVRNWYNFTWLSGDGLVEQAIHTVDWLAWTKNDVVPKSCTAVGGRQIPAEGGNIFDHIEVNYVWDDGTRGFVAQRQISGCHNENSLYVLGTKGTAQIGGRGVVIEGESPWKYQGPNPNMYDVEHQELFQSIREGNPINNGDRMCTSTLMGIMGRMAGYTGKQVTWDMLMGSRESLVPEITNGWDTPMDFPGYAMPGVTPFV
jgi:predicted dehydrogenase